MRIPGPKWGAGRPPLETPKSSLARQTRPNSSPLARLELRCRWGRPRAPTRSPRLPHLHRFGLGAYAPLPPAFPVRERLPVMHVWGAYAPLPPRSPLGNVCRSCANAHGTASETACGQRLRKSNAEAPAAQRRGVPSLPSRGCAEGTLARPQRGNPKGGAALFGQSLPTFCWPESRGPARPERVEGKNYNFK